MAGAAAAVMVTLFEPGPGHQRWGQGAQVADHGASSKVPYKKRPRLSTERRRDASSGGPMAANRNGARLCVAFNDGSRNLAGKNDHCLQNEHIVHQRPMCVLQGHGAHTCSGQVARPVNKGKTKGKRGMGGEPQP